MKLHQIVIASVLLFGAVLAAGCGSNAKTPAPGTPEMQKLDQEAKQKVESTEGS